MKLQFLAIFLIIQALIFTLFYYLFNYIEPFKESFLLSFVALIPAILLMGYMLYEFIIEPKSSQDRVLMQLVKETLHEINLPISTIEANTKMLQKQESSQKSLNRLDRVLKAVERLKRLYLQLNYSIKKEIMPIEKERVDLDNLIRKRVSIFKEFNRNPFNLELEEFVVFVDKIGLEQVIDNIIENAMKYSSKDSLIDIIIRDKKLIIKDRGVGIAEDELSLIYQRYYQEDETNIGEGIGLSIVKNYCENSGILLKIESKKGIGTEVILDFSKHKVDKI